MSNPTYISPPSGRYRLYFVSFFIPLRWNISAEKKEAKLQRAFDLFPELHYAYLMLQDFHSVLDEKTLYEKKLMLGKWILDYVDSECPDVAAAARTIRYWKQMIINSWQYNRSNGPAEGLNDKIKVVKRFAFGMHRFDAFRKRILLICGPIVPSDEYVRIQWDQLPLFFRRFSWFICPAACLLCPFSCPYVLQTPQPVDS